ncbi:MAG TPA: hypothetical protein VHG71_10440 [Verrucomicrobiae bacterium]|nr:hypothetical protein [Verrucomicrobiae bacterium]
MSGQTPKKHSYLVELFRAAWEDVEWIEIFSEAFGGLVIAFIFLKNGIAPEDENLELYLEAVAYAFVIPIIAFLLRLLFITPTKLYRKLYDKNFKVDIVPAKESHLISVLLAICACLTFIIIIENISHFPHKKQSELAAIKTLPNLRPDKVTSKLGTPSQSVPITPALTEKIYETNSPQTLDTNNSMLENAISERHTQEAQKEKSIIEQIQNHWDLSIPFFNHTLEVLHELMNKEAERRGDRIVIPSDYYACLPKSFNFPTNIELLTEIRLETSTNIDFKIGITINSPPMSDFMTIKGSVGDLKIILFYGGMGGSCEIQTTPYSDSKQFGNVNANIVIDEMSKIFVEAQSKYGMEK